jgi:DNA-binding SARP family transcriptional activator
MRIPQVVARLLGRPSLLINDAEVLSDLPHKDQELFCYLVLFRTRQHRRETLATLLWSENPSEQSRKYLRQSLWRLHEALALGGVLDPRKVLPADPEWVQFAMTRAIWLDVVEFEGAAIDGFPPTRAQDGGYDLARGSMAAELYRGDLLEGTSSEWCLPERERYRQLYLKVVDALLSIYEVRKEFDRGIACGTRSLEVDPARESTYRAIMRLLFMKGDRTSALRAYERCAAVIQTEFGVTPEAETEALVAEIRAGRGSLSSSSRRSRR